jgi:hypothetical protein
MVLFRDSTMGIEFNPFQLPEGAFGRALRDVEEFDEVSPGRAETKWKYLGGKNLRSMRQSFKVTKNYLNHADSNKRLCAACLVGDYWDPKEIFVSPCLKLAFWDPETVVRGAALRALCKLDRFIHDSTGYLKNLLQSITEPYSQKDQKQLKQLETEVADEIEKLNHIMQKQWKELAGSHLANMLKDVAAAINYLSHPDPNLRRVAMSIIYNHWKPTPEYSRLCENLLINDPDFAARFTALDILISYYFDSNDVRIGELLANIVYDNSKPINFRKLAYKGLFNVRGMPSRISFFNKIQFPNEVDWSFVNTFLKNRPGTFPKKGV